MGSTAVEATVLDSLGLTASFALEETILVLSSALDIALTSEEEKRLPVVEQFMLTAAALPLAVRLELLEEALSLQHRLIPVNDVVVNDAVTLAALLAGVPSAVVAVVESLRLTGSAQSSLTALAQIVEVLAARDLLALVKDETVLESAALAAALEARVTALQTLLSTAAFADDLAGMAQVTVLLEDGVELDDTLTPTAMFLATIIEGLDFSVSFVFDGVPYSGYSLNAATKAVTTYTNYPFNSMAVFNGEVHAASAEGLYKLGGADDAGTPIIWKIRTGMSNYGTGRNKGLDAAYLGYTATGRIALKCIIVAPTGEKIVYWYELTPRPAATPTPGRITMGRGLRSVYWGFELTNVDAGDIELDVLELHPIVLDGRLP
jgi:hypothetical protein